MRCGSFITPNNLTWVIAALYTKHRLFGFSGQNVDEDLETLFYHRKDSPERGRKPTQPGRTPAMGLGRSREFQATLGVQQLPSGSPANSLSQVVALPCPDAWECREDPLVCIPPQQPGSHHRFLLS